MSVLRRKRRGIYPGEIESCFGNIFIWIFLNIFFAILSVIFFGGTVLIREGFVLLTKKGKPASGKKQEMG
jgi:hypothetical protein